MTHTILFRSCMVQTAPIVNRQLTGLTSMKHYIKALPTAKVNGLLTGLVNEALFQSTANR